MAAENKQSLTATLFAVWIYVINRLMCVPRNLLHPKVGKRLLYSYNV